jgi:hypothetical protein
MRLRLYYTSIVTPVVVNLLIKRLINAWQRVEGDG